MRQVREKELCDLYSDLTFPTQIPEIVEYSALSDTWYVPTQVHEKDLCDLYGNLVYRSVKCDFF